MDGMLLVLAWLLPLALASLAFGRAGRWLLPIASLPALIAALRVPAGTGLEIPWLLLGTHLGLDATGRMFLLFSTLLWLFAGTYAALSPTRDRHAGRFRLFFLVAMAGNLLLILAADIVTFYFGFALMGLAGYGLVAHRRSQSARRAARVYLAWTLAGEVALFAAVILLAAASDSLRFADLAQRELSGPAVALLLVGFGIKLALPGLHVWLPLAYTGAPAVAAAVLSGPMINAGLLGWLRFLPAGAPGLSEWGTLVTLLGGIGVALGVLVGVTQRDPRAVLAYSSIAKTGLIAAAFGLALDVPEAGAAITGALVAFAMHHLVVKGALFLGIGEWERSGNSAWLLAGLGGLSLAMIGAPLTGGAAAKIALGDALADSATDLHLLFAFSATGTVLLMARFMWLVARAGTPERARLTAASLAWLSLAVPAVWLPFGPGDLPLAGDGLAPITAGLAIAATVYFTATRGPHRRWPGIPPGDIIHLLPAWRRQARTRPRSIASCAPR